MAEEPIEMIVTTSNMVERTKEFLSHFFDMGGDEEIVIYGGAGAPKGWPMEASVVVKLGGKKYPFTTQEARAVISVIALAALQFPHVRDADGLAQLMGAIAFAVDQADDLFRKGTLQ